MIHFRCWYCGKNYLVQESRTGEKRVCSCERRIHIPSESNGNCRDRSALDWIIEWTVYGIGGALLGGLLALFLVTRVPFLMRRGGIVRMVLLSALIGLLAGGLGGEAGINWLGRTFRDRNEKD
jgi:hypothetical protein